MLTETDFFEKDDTVIFTKDKIILQKEQHNNDIFLINKYLKDLDGNWNLDVITKKEEDVNYSPEQWIHRNENICFEIFNDIKSKSDYSSILSELTYSNLCVYLENCTQVKYVNQDKKWILYEENKMYGIKNPCQNIWASFFIKELHFLYNLYTLSSNLSFGTVDEFITFCFDNSYKKQLPQY